MIRPAATLPRRCVGCGYDLAGLPPVGKCPECGAGFDHAAAGLVLLGWARGWRANGENASGWRKVYWALYAGMLSGFLLMPAGWIRLPFAALFIAVCVADAVWVFSRRNSHTARGAVPPGRAYLGPDGYGQADGVVPPALRPWGPDDEIAVGPAGFRAVLADGGPGVHRQRLTVAPRPAPAWWTLASSVKHVDFAFDATFAESAEIREQVEAWRDTA